MAQSSADIRRSCGAPPREGHRSPRFSPDDGADRSRESENLFEPIPSRWCPTATQASARSQRTGPLLVQHSRVGEDATDDRLEHRERHGLVGRVERALIPTFAKLRAGNKMRVTPMAFPLVLIAPGVLEVVVALEEAVMPDDPRGFFADERPQQGRRDLAMVEEANSIGDVMQERDGNGFLVGIIAKGARGCLQRVAEAVDLVAHFVAALLA